MVSREVCCTHQAAPDLARLLRDLVNLLLVKVKVRRFPVVDQHGPVFVRPRRLGQVVAVQPVKVPRHLAKPVARVHGDGFGRVERPARRDRPVQLQRVHPDQDPVESSWAALDRRRERPGVDQTEPIRVARGLRRARRGDTQEWVVQMARKPRERLEARVSACVSARLTPGSPAARFARRFALPAPIPHSTAACSAPPTHARGPR